MQNMYKNVVLNSCPKDPAQATSASPWYNFYNIPVIIRIYDTQATITNLYGKVPQPPNKLQTCNIIYNRESQDYFTVAQFINAQQPAVLKQGCYKTSDYSNKQHTPGILDPAHAIPDIQVPQVQVPTMTPKIDVQLDVDVDNSYIMNLSAPLTYYSRSVGAGTTAISRAAAQVCGADTFKTNADLGGYSNGTCRYYVQTTSGSVKIYGVRYINNKVTGYLANTLNTGFLNTTATQGTSTYIYCIVTRVDKNTYTAELGAGSTVPASTDTTVYKLVATVTVGSAQQKTVDSTTIEDDSNAAITSPQVSGKYENKEYGYQGGSSWLKEAFAQWNAIANSIGVTRSGRCSVSVTQHICGALIVYEHQFGASEPATAAQLKSGALSVVGENGTRYIGLELNGKDAAIGNASNEKNSLLVVQEGTGQTGTVIKNIKATANNTCQILNYNKGSLTLTPVSPTEGEDGFTILTCTSKGITTTSAPLSGGQDKTIILGATDKEITSILLPTDVTTYGYALGWDGADFINNPVPVVNGPPSDAGYYAAVSGGSSTGSGSTGDSSTGGSSTGGSSPGQSGYSINWEPIGALEAGADEGTYWVSVGGDKTKLYNLIKVTMPEADEAGYFLSVTTDSSSGAVTFSKVALGLSGTATPDGQYLVWDGSEFGTKKLPESNLPGISETEPGQFLTYVGGKFSTSDKLEATPAGYALRWTGTTWGTVPLIGVDAPPDTGYYMATKSGASFTWVKAALVPAASTDKACLISIGADGKAELIEVGTPPETKEKQALTYNASSGFGTAAFALATDITTLEEKITTVTNTANSAEANASKAKSDAAEALDKAKQADGTAEKAKETADSAKQAADAAKDTAQSASSTANSIASTADQAKTAATKAQQTADNLGVTVTNLQTTVNGLESTVTDVDTRITNAQNTADAATTTAMLAQDTAYQAQQAANGARPDKYTSTDQALTYTIQGWGTIPVNQLKLPTIPTAGGTYVLGWVGGSLAWLQTAPGQAPTWPN